MTLQRYDVDERGHMRPSPNGYYVTFNQYEMMKDSDTKGWALAKSLQTQVDILTTAVNFAALKEIPLSDQDAYPFLKNIVKGAHAASNKLEEHRKS